MFSKYMIFSMVLITSLSVQTIHAAGSVANPLKLSGSTLNFKPKIIMIKFADALPSRSVQKFLLRQNLKIEFQSDLVPNLVFVEIPEARSLEGLKKWLSASPLVEFVEIDSEISASVDPEFGKQYYLDNIGQQVPQANGTEGVTGEDIGLLEALSSRSEQSQEAIVVAVIDSGVAISHPDLQPNIWVNLDENDSNGDGYVGDLHGYNFVDGNTDVTDQNGHGTHVAGVIGAQSNNGLGIHGIADGKVKIMALKVLDENGSGNLSDAANALEYAIKNGAKISNNSYGGATESAVLTAMIESSPEHLFVAAAGNSGANLDSSLFGLSLLSSNSYPASATSENILSVAAIDNQGNLADYSNYGNESVDIAAFGTDVYSTIPGGYAYMSGTSMASPVVTGIAAYLSHLYPNKTAKELKEAIMLGGVPNTNYSGKLVSGNRADLYQSIEFLEGAYTPETDSGDATGDNNPLLGIGLLGL
ncbi:S8 family serine peptidase [Thiomicrorhabdus sp. 6S2-11]|uniref:S8 family serine peptidase n=1 Tax=Thiomicrorhabdus marina TaxID=2818442 RepID=A0ABS3Q7B8_9GAMM|nr:S8 family peptidase [Thiomicrorhabdus marina]MBO1928201.1 S8 family serine peptidase [Thiomicrorhabdus marina]